MIRASHRIASAGLSQISFSLGFYSELSVQDLLHWHLFIKTAAGFHLSVALFSTTLPLLLHRCTHHTQQSLWSVTSQYPDEMNEGFPSRLQPAKYFNSVLLESAGSISFDTKLAIVDKKVHVGFLVRWLNNPNYKITNNPN